MHALIDQVIDVLLARHRDALLKALAVQTSGLERASYRLLSGETMDPAAILQGLLALRHSVTMLAEVVRAGDRAA